ncbi:MAG: copper chaperone PCu(A)C [Pseudolabrys sp.]
MIRNALIVAAVFAAWAAVPAQAKDVTVGSLKLSAPWARATPKGASVGGGYLTITNAGTTPDRLVGGTSAIAQEVQVHQMTMDNGVMKMRPVTGGLEIKPGQTVTLKPGGYHIMFMKLTRQLKQGEHFKVTLDFAKAGKVDVDFTTEGIAAQSGGGHDMHNMGGMKMK